MRIFTFFKTISPLNLHIYNYIHIYNPFISVCQAIWHGRGVAPSANYSRFDKDLTNAIHVEVSTPTWSTQTRDMYESHVGYLVAPRP